ncbi:hypothetical protein PISMIDRAFT_14732 [Pisolithus microcarpus 441]|uniref:Uncharacterized protein n=1 Tax=Pisolithus microcarpus 441 TaxID=765257 RepID=A0A0C9ZD98_9AGAM|nr:hypothetical protein PISMIDRAFT_14732 [Pisolithus microcarpus 441]
MATLLYQGPHIACRTTTVQLRRTTPFRASTTRTFSAVTHCTIDYGPLLLSMYFPKSCAVQAPVCETVQRNTNIMFASSPERGADLIIKWSRPVRYSSVTPQPNFDIKETKNRRSLYLCQYVRPDTITPNDTNG